MGNIKFRLSEIIPNSWFYKLKYMRKSRSRNSNSLKKKKGSNVKVSSPEEDSPTIPAKILHKNPRKSYYFTREFQPESDTLKVKEIVRKKSSSPPAADCSGEEKLVPLIFRADGFLETRTLEQVMCKSSETSFSGDVVIGVDSESVIKPEKCEESHDGDGEVYLPRIVTQLGKKKKGSKVSGNGDDQDKTTSSVSSGTRRSYQSSTANSPGIKLRTNSPRIGGRKSFHSHHVHHSGQSRKSSSRLSSNLGSRKSLSSSSLAIVKSSFNPQKDFRESMLEMISENNLSRSKELEELLACYLSLNSDEYHTLIINVFKQIWFDLS